MVTGYLQFLHRRAWAVLSCCLALLLVSGFLASRLVLKAQISELLPAGDPAVVQLDRLIARVGSSTTFIIIFKSDNATKNRSFADALAKRLRQEPPGTWRSISYETSQERDYFSRFGILYADLEDLIAMRDAIKRQLDLAKTGSVSFEDEESLSQLQARLQAKYQQRFRAQLLFPTGYFEATELGVEKLVMVIRPATEALGGDETELLYAKIDGYVQETKRALGERVDGVTPIYTGDIPSTLQEKRALKEDLGVASLACIILVCAVITFYFRQLRAVFFVSAPALMGTLFSFGIAKIFIGSLNSNTAFLGSIILGNGINYAIVLLSRLHEERRQNSAAPLDSLLLEAMRATWRPTLASAVGASAAYGSLLVTRFRGFNQFGFVGGAGMLLCWLLTFSVLPALIIVVERRWPSRVENVAGPRRDWFGSVFLTLIRAISRRPVAFLAVTCLLSVAALYPVSRVISDPFEYNFLKLRNKRSLTEGAASHQKEVLQIFGRSLTPGLLLADSPEEALEAREKIIARDDASARQCVGQVEALGDLLPSQQPEKFVVLSQLMAMLSDDTIALAKPEIVQQSERLLERLAPLFPSGAPNLLRFEDLPESVAAPYTELDGTRGRLLQLQRGKGVSGWDGRDLNCFANATSEIPLSTGKLVAATGVAEVVNDMINAIIRDGPRATLASFLVVVCLLLIAFRSVRGFGVVLLSLLLGVSLMLGIAALLEMRLNFFNFVAIPITLGIASEYGVNLYERASSAPKETLTQALASTGGAIALCSLTTIIGYSTLLLSDNQALNSFGLLAGLGEVTTLLTAVIVVSTTRE